MKFGIMAMPQHPATDSATQRFHETVELTRLARDAGFSSIACGQHFLSPPYQNLQSIPLLARLAADAGDMRLVLSILLLPLYAPADVAETIATLDVISDGRVVLGVGLGYRDIEYQAFNVARRHRVGRFLESLELVRRLWTEDEVTHHGRHFHLDNATCAIRPVQQPHPPIWVAANFDTVVRRAGELGLPWFVNPHATLATLERQTAIYREGLAAGGREMPAEMPIIKEMHIAPTHEEAVRNARPYMEAKYQAYADWGQDKALPGDEDFRIPFEELARDRFILGSSEEVIQQIEDHHHRVGANHFMFRIWYPGMDARMAMRVVEQMGDSVIPYFESRYGDDDPAPGGGPAT